MGLEEYYMPGKLSEIWGTGKVLSAAFSEQVECLKQFYAMADEVLQSPDWTPAAYEVSMGPVPKSFFSLRKNVFSTVFFSMYFLLDLPRERRLLYGQLNHLARVWVTSADNLLDLEDKEVLPLEMAGNSRVMRQVVSIMTADRVMNHLLSTAIADGMVTEAQAARLSNESLRILLPSAAQEATEEGGITVRPDPEEVLSTIHRLKTGILFNIPFMGPDVIESQLDHQRVDAMKEALMQFGVGCQVLDDIRDLAKDFVEGRHNYLLSVLAKEQHPILLEWGARSLDLDVRLDREIRSVALPAARRGLQMISGGLQVLREMGLGFSAEASDRMALSMFTMLDLGDLAYEVHV